MAKAVIRKTLKREPVEEDPEKWVAEHFEFRHQFLVGVKVMKDGKRVPDVGTWEEVQDEIRALLEKRFPGGNFTPSGGYLLIREDDGKVRACYPHDFDYETMARKPGTMPPAYTLSHEDQLEVRRLQQEVEQRVKHEKEYAERTGNGLARNPTNLLTARETDSVQRIARKHRLTKPVQTVEWTEADAADENLAEEETAKLLQESAVPKRRPVLKRKK